MTVWHLTMEVWITAPSKFDIAEQYSYRAEFATEAAQNRLFIYDLILRTLGSHEMIPWL